MRALLTALLAIPLFACGDEEPIGPDAAPPPDAAPDDGGVLIPPPPPMIVDPPKLQAPSLRPISPRITRPENHF
jgi:hypothetical protein